MQRLRHPNIVALYRFYEGDPAALVMEYVPGPTLAALVEADGWLSPTRAAGIVEGVAAALDCAHAQGVIHRDVKPSNILLPKRGPARLTDFGVVHIDHDVPLTMMGDVLGTIEYASPEQVRGSESPDVRSDVYSLAAVAYFALTGTPPFRAADTSTQSQLSVMHRQVFADPPPLRFHREEIPLSVERVVLRGLAKAPEARYQSAGQLAAALRVAVEAESGAPEKPAMDASSRRTGALAGALTGGAVLLLAALVVWHGKFSSPASSPGREIQVVGSSLPPRFAPAPVEIASSPSHSSPSRVLREKPRRRGRKSTGSQVVSRPALAIKPTSHKVVAAKEVAETKRAAGTKTVPKPSTHAKLAAKTFAPKRRLALIPKPARAVKLAAPRQGWLYVYASQNVAPLGQTPRLTNIRPQAIYVDGRPVPALTASRWAALPSGTHTLSFFPDARSGFSPHTGIRFIVRPGAHVSRQVLLPLMTNFTPRLVPLPAPKHVLEASPAVSIPSVPPHLRNP